MQDDAFTNGEPISTETLSARTITVVTLLSIGSAFWGLVAGVVVAAAGRIGAPSV